MGVNSVQITTSAVTAKPLFVQGPGNAGDGTFFNVNGSVGDLLPTIIRNIDATNSVYIGDDEVSTTNGFLLKAGESFPVTWLGSDAAYLWCIAAAGTPVVAILAGRQPGV
jgi:hypothetical protein